MNEVESESPSADSRASDGQTAARSQPTMANKRDSYTSSMALLLAGLLFSVKAQRQAKMLTCVCTTTHCETIGVRTCNTTEMCFTEYLERAGGSGPISRGCITQTTPLLCENRPPATKGNWPLLLCCNFSMCNQEGIPTPPPWHSDKGNATSATKTDHIPVADAPIETKARNAADRPRIISPVYISVLVVGIGLLLVIGGVAAVVLRRHSRFYSREFGIDRRSYLKGQDLASVARLHVSDSSRNGLYNDSKAILST